MPIITEGKLLTLLDVTVMTPPADHPHQYTAVDRSFADHIHGVIGLYKVHVQMSGT
jgi:hypothetical protein